MGRVGRLCESVADFDFTVADDQVIDQLKLGDARANPEFAGTIRAVETRPFKRSDEQSPSGFGYHWNHNAEKATFSWEMPWAAPWSNCWSADRPSGNDPVKSDLSLEGKPCHGCPSPRRLFQNADLDISANQEEE